jgi:alkanesulfonate monooxygenase SsuD/methylene tetrahydromethanopterin reductase-like flavin-dependent oxidoreductase (luciferase family)
MAGRGSFIESFPLFGYNLEDYDELFAEKLRLLLELREGERVNWSGRHRAPLEGVGIYPRPVQERLPVWIAVGGTPASVVRAAKLGLPMALAIIGGPPERFVPFVELYRRTAEEAGHDPGALQISINSHTFVADSSAEAADTFFPSYSETMSRIGRERGWPPTTRAQFEASRGPRGALLVGSPDEVVEKILYEYRLFGHQRFMAQLTVGPMPHDRVMRAIELFGTKVAPAVREATSSAERRGSISPDENEDIRSVSELE